MQTLSVFDCLPDSLVRRGPTARARKVRAGSHQKGRCERGFWGATNKAETNRIMLAAKKFELATRRAGARNGALGHVALEVLEALRNLVDHRTGQLDPSLEYLMTKLRRSRDAIVRALKALRSHGFLAWLRRYEPTGNEGRGPQVRQTSNAYRLSLPARAALLLGRFGVPAPVPDDYAHREQEQAALVEAYMAALSTAERMVCLFGSDKLSIALARLGAAVDMKKQRESAKQTETISNYIS